MKLEHNYDIFFSIYYLFVNCFIVPFTDSSRMVSGITRSTDAKNYTGLASTTAELDGLGKTTTATYDWTDERSQKTKENGKGDDSQRDVNDHLNGLRIVTIKVFQEGELLNPAIPVGEGVGFFFHLIRQQRGEVRLQRHRDNGNFSKKRFCMESTATPTRLTR